MSNVHQNCRHCLNKHISNSLLSRYLGWSCYLCLFFSVYRSTLTSNKYDIPPEKKWISLFSQCRQALGCHGDQDADVKAVWQCISVALKSRRDSKLSHTDKEILQDLFNINTEMEQSAKVTLDWQKMHLYLSKVSKNVGQKHLPPLSVWQY